MSQRTLFSEPAVCGRCRKLILTPDDNVTVRIGGYPARRVCEDCAQDLQLACVTKPELSDGLPIDPTPSR
jgi:hypothetical protein